MTDIHQSIIDRMRNGERLRFVTPEVVRPNLPECNTLFLGKERIEHLSPLESAVADLALMKVIVETKDDPNNAVHSSYVLSSEKEF